MEETLTTTQEKYYKSRHSEYSPTHTTTTPKDRLHTVEEFVQQLEQAVKERL